MRKLHGLSISRWKDLAIVQNNDQHLLILKVEKEDEVDMM